MYGYLLYNQLVVVLIMFCLLMIIQDIPGSIHYIENLMCLKLLLNLKPLPKSFFLTSIKQIQTDNDEEFTSNQFNFI
jgi:hypothetical protein